MLWKYVPLSSAPIEHLSDLTQERERTDVSVSIPLHDRIFDLVLLSNWEDQIVYEPENVPSRAVPPEKSLTTPANKTLESGAWTRSIIWSPRAPFRDFTQLEFNHEDDVVPEERPSRKSSKSPGSNNAI